jgi:hypothetical protein
MRFDVQNQLSTAQAFTGTATVSTNAYQIANSSVYNTANKPDISIGRRMSLLVLITTAAGSGSTHTWDAVSATNTALTGTLTVLNTITNLAATLTAGYAFEIPIPQKSISQLFLGARNTSTGGTTTVSADIYIMPADELPAFESFVKVVDALV